MARTVMRTLLFAIHDPSKRTEAILKRTLRCYTQACRLVAEGAAEDWDQIAQDALYNGRLSAMSLERNLRERYGRRVPLAKYPLHSSAREAVFADVAAALSSYAALTQVYERSRERALAKIAEQGLSLDPPAPEAEQILGNLGEAPSWPTIPVVRPNYTTYEGVLEALRSAGPGAPTPPVRLSQALNHGTRPLFFPRADGAARNRNFALLRTEGHEGPRRNGARTVRSVRARRQTPRVRPKRVLYRALLYVLPAGDERMRPLPIPPSGNGWDPLVPLQPVPEGLTAERIEELAPGLFTEEEKERLAREGLSKERGEQLKDEGRDAEMIEALVRADAGRQRMQDLLLRGLQRSGRVSPALLVPLECGKWHERTLDLAVHNPEMVRAARLVHRPARIMAGGRRVAEKFFLAVTFEHPVPDLRVPECYMGISMDEKARIGWYVRTISDGQTLAAGSMDDLWGVQERWRQRRRAAMQQGKLPPRQHHRQREQVRHAVHKIVNALLDVADQYTAQAAITDVRYLRLRRPFLPRDPVTGRRMGRSEAWHEAKAEAAYRRACLVVGDLERIYNYKCLQRGLPTALSIGGISPRDCAHCGGRGEDTDFCTRCGEALSAQNTAHITANRIPVTLERIREARAKRKKKREEEQNGDTGE